MKRILYPLLLLILLAPACTLPTTASPPAQTAKPAATFLPPDGNPPTRSPTSGGPASEHRCGDGVCDGPENAQICPQDCPVPAERTQPAATENSVPLGEPASQENAYWVGNPASGARLYVQVTHPQDWDGSALPALVLVPGGSGSGGSFLTPPSTAQQLADAGMVVIVFDPDGRGRSEGQEDDDGFIQQDGLAAVLRFAAALPEVDADRLGLVSFSYGITMASGALARHPDLPVLFLIDWEGPADRNDTGGCDAAHTGHLQAHACDDEAFWSEREAAAFATQLALPYQRIQSEKDHVQPDLNHAILMVDNATAVEYGGRGIAPWTRLNDLPPNTVYDPAAPPPMLSEQESKHLEPLIVRYALELFDRFAP